MHVRPTPSPVVYATTYVFYDHLYVLCLSTLLEATERQAGIQTPHNQKLCQDNWRQCRR
jgi:hypothetical protein